MPVEDYSIHAHCNENEAVTPDDDDGDDDDDDDASLEKQ